MKTKIIINPIFPCNLEIVYEKDIEKMNEQLKVYKIDDIVWYFTSSAMFVEDYRTNMNFILLTDTDSNSIAHEVVHVVFSLLNNCWIPTSKDNEETFAYLVDYYVREISEFLKSK